MKIKAPNESKGWGQAQIGTSSLVLIFTVLCLVVFSTLSLASATVDLRLAEKNSRYVAEYYAGDAKAEVALKQMDEGLEELTSLSNGEKPDGLLLKEKFGDLYDMDSNRLNFVVDLNEDQLLSVKLEPVLTGKTGEIDKNYRIKAWIVQNKVDYEIEDDMPVWDGSRLETE